ncbi:hypothetical protein ACFV5N_09335 [Streptomyces sp. NPDC059853]|uniref:hypothetical protein n=1 Tax=Streptomyces sp. NPDC059853 TaxID=3346973 RepID=UPI0036572109
MPERIPPMKRVRVRGGRLVHAVIRDEAGIARTACGSRRLRAVDSKEWDSTPITCPRCTHAIAARSGRHALAREILTELDAIDAEADDTTREITARIRAALPTPDDRPQR